MRPLGLLFLCGLVVVVTAACAPSSARADLAPCPAAPASYSGGDALVAAVTQLDADSVASCTALAARLDALAQDVQQAEGAAHTDAGAAEALLGEIKSTVSGWTASSPLHVVLPDGGSGQAVQITNWPASQTVGFDTTTSAVLDGQAQSEHGDLWVLIGVVVGCFLMSEVLRKVWP